MTLDELAAPYGRRRVIRYGAGGNKVVRHWEEVQHVVGSLYRGRSTQDEYGQTECDLFIFFPDVKDGLLFETVKGPFRFTVERADEAVKRAGYDSACHMVAAFNEHMEKDVFIGNAEIEFVWQFDPAAAEKFAQYRLDFYARREERERLARQEREDMEKAVRQAELVSLKALYLGWADDMTPLRFGRVDATLSALCRIDGKVTSRRQFVISSVKDGWEPQKDEGVTTWYGSRWEPKESKPKTVYKLVKDGFCYEIIKTEYDFAVYLAEHRAALGL